MKQVKLFYLFSIFYYSFFYINNVNAASYNLFQLNEFGRPRATSNYDQIVENLYPGDEVEFTNGKKIRIGKFIGSGVFTRVFEVDGNPSQVLRIPLKSNSCDMMNAFLEGQKKLLDSGGPVVKNFDFLPGEFAVVERIRTKGTQPFDFYDFLRPKSQVPKDLKQKMSEAAIEFAREMAKYDYISDFKRAQVLFDEVEGKWKIADLGGSVKIMKGMTPDLSDYPYRTIGSELFEGLANTEFLRELYERFEKTYKNERETLLKSGFGLHSQNHSFDFSPKPLHTLTPAAPLAASQDGRDLPKKDTSKMPMKRLFEKTSSEIVPVHNYDEVLKGLKPGDQVQLSDGRVIQIGKKFTSYSSIIGFEVVQPGIRNGDQIIYFPSSSNREPTSLVQKFFKKFQESFSSSSSGALSSIPTPKKVSSLPNECVIARGVPATSINFDEFVTGSRSRDPNLQRKMVESLKQFAKTTSGIIRVPGLNTHSLVYNPDLNQWMLKDWLGTPETAATSTQKTQGTLLDSLFMSYLNEARSSNGHSPSVNKSIEARRPEYQFLVTIKSDIEREIISQRTKTLPFRCVTESLSRSL